MHELLQYARQRCHCTPHHGSVSSAASAAAAGGPASPASQLRELPSSSSSSSPAGSLLVTFLPSVLLRRPSCGPGKQSSSCCRYAGVPRCIRLLYVKCLPASPSECKSDWKAPSCPTGKAAHCAPPGAPAPCLEHCSSPPGALDPSSRPSIAPTPPARSLPAQHQHDLPRLRALCRATILTAILCGMISDELKPKAPKECASSDR